MMASDKIPDNLKKWLQDESFVCWCLAPTDESNAQWRQYMDAHPEACDALAEARDILQTLRLNPVERTPDESLKLWKRIENDMERKDNQRRRFTIARYAAACMLVLAIVGFRTFLKKQPGAPDDDRMADLPNKQTEITLIQDNAGIVEIENNAVISFDTAITIQSPARQTTVLPTTPVEKREAYNTLVVPRGRRTSLLLADGSRVWINSGTTLHFPTGFESNERKIKVEGEIYLEVSPDSRRPFLVETPQMTVCVLGTKFNISAYKTDVSQAVVLVEGSVRIVTKADESFLLHPNQRFNLSPASLFIDEVDVYDHISWIDGIFRFRGETMDEIAQRLSRYYNVPITCAPAIAQKRTSGKLMLFDRIEQVMETFEMLYDIRYTIQNESIRIE
jgi:ferric-dicitrate binding protein FerR (iron transport regulator)